MKKLQITVISDLKYPEAWTKKGGGGVALTFLNWVMALFVNEFPISFGEGWGISMLPRGLNSNNSYSSEEFQESPNGLKRGILRRNIEKINKTVIFSKLLR